MKTLILYATKHGTAGKCASLLSKKLTGDVSLHNLKEGARPDPAKYDNVIIGGSIYAGRIQKEVNMFCSQNLEQLKGKTIGLYICCMNKNGAQMQLNSAYPQELLNCAVAKEGFGGEFRFGDMSFIERFITRMIAKADASYSGLDMKKDVSMLDEKSMDRFAQMMNKG